MTTHAITRRPGPDAARGLTSAGLGEPDWGLLLRQHGDYVEHLKRLGLEVIELDALQAHPDAYFVEDPAIVAPGFAVITIPGVPSRRGEQASLEKVLKAYREIEHITLPGTVDGGDVLMAGSHFFVGVSARTNAEGARQLGAILERRGHSWTAVTVKSGLHLKSDVNSLGHETLLLTPAFETRTEFQAYAKIVVPEQEAYAANSLLVNERLFVPRGFPETRNILQGAGYDVTELDMSEVQKMDGGLTCLSLRFTQ